jgi:hypothetical protein
MKISVPKRFNEFGVDFSMSQNIHSIRRKLHQAVSILEGTLNILSTITNHSVILCELTDLRSSVQHEFLTRLDQISGEMKSSLLTAQNLLNFAEDIQQIVCTSRPRNFFTFHSCGHDRANTPSHYRTTMSSPSGIKNRLLRTASFWRNLPCQVILRTRS